MKEQQTIYLSLGSNKGNRLNNLQKAINEISKQIGQIKQISSIYKTPSLGFNGDFFFNICIKLYTRLPSNLLLQTILSIEKKIGRIRKQQKQYINRLIDIDILLIDKKIIVSENLIVPHPSMLKRKFVLTPLTDIAKNILHPTINKTIINCLKNCIDHSEIIKINSSLEYPFTIEKKYNYIAIEGNIGAGKTSLANMISQDYNIKTVFERFTNNPFLPNFYNNKKRYAFTLEMSFLTDRYQQLSEDIAQFDLFKNCIISDYYIFKSLIFSRINLPDDEYKLYRKIFDIMYKEITKPDLYVYLYQNTNRLLNNIKKRGRYYEKKIDENYLNKIQDGYKNFINTHKDLNILVIDVSKLDFVNKTQEYYTIINKIINYTK